MKVVIKNLNGNVYTMIVVKYLKVIGGLYHKVVDVVFVQVFK
jgi:hypothetical protein